MNSTNKTLCPLCGSSTNDTFIIGFDRVSPKKENFTYVKCKECNLVFLYPLPTDEEIKTFYDIDYGPHQYGNVNKVNHRHFSFINKFLINNYFHVQSNTTSQSRLKRYIAKKLSIFALKNLFAPYGENRLLDVGCGNGLWLYQHLKLGWHAEGVEMNAAACKKATNLGLNIYQGTIYDVPLTNKYDIITFNHVIEHVLDPLETLSQAKKLLAPNGLIVMLLPNIDSYGFKKFSNCWFPLDPPRHIIQFSPETVRLLIDKVGLDVRDIHTIPKARFMIKSRIYKKYLSNDFIKINDITKRRTLIEECIKKGKKQTLESKIYKKIMFFYSYFLNKNSGEILKVTAQNNEN